LHHVYPDKANLFLTNLFVQIISLSNFFIIKKLLSLLSEEREELEICIGITGKWCDVRCPFVTSISSHSFKARRLKFGKNNTHMLLLGLFGLIEILTLSIRSLKERKNEGKGSGKNITRKTTLTVR